ncbi:TetR/AcrR family transcriptional regulator [Subtercola endophyticus]|uniref:TetR/AcrR family transcriptional regulator n=1 Tax=Subtercola endophyticus TaxID=2895559 RepID=UPI0036F1B9EB
MPVRGRPREFDLDEAIDQAVEVFWRQGYEGATLDNLTAAMGISRPSLYAAFGNKGDTFKLAVARYAEIDMAYVGEAIAQPAARAVAEHYLRSNVAAITGPGRPAGCLSIQGGWPEVAKISRSSTSSATAAPGERRGSRNDYSARSMTATCPPPRTPRNSRDIYPLCPADSRSKPPPARHALSSQR